jgi:hypothetical protein
MDRLFADIALGAVTILMLTVFAGCSRTHAEDIPLEKIITTSPQAKMRQFDEVFPNTNDQTESEAAREYLRPFQSATAGPSNAFLVDAMDARDAIEASKTVFFGGRSADTPAPVNQPDPKRGNYWLAAYLGIGPSGPTAFVIETVTLRDGGIRLVYSKPTARAATADIHHYYYWVPIGQLRPGEYNIELFDSGLKKVTLSRRVVLEEEKGKKK